MLKVFLGSLHRDINKPVVQGLRGFHELYPVQIDVPSPKWGMNAMAFLIFNSPEEAAGAITVLSGLEDQHCSPGAIQAFRVVNMGAFNTLGL